MIKNILLICIAFVLFTACKKTDYTLNSEDGPQVSEVIWFDSITNTTLVADSSSSIEIHLAIHSEADTAFDAISLETDNGFFPNGSQTYSASVNGAREAIVTLYSGINDGPAHIRATINSISIDTTLTFNKAYPSDILLNPTLVTTTGQDVKIGLDLIRNTGRVGENIRVLLDYEPLDTTGVLLDLAPFMVVENKSDSISLSNPLGLTGNFQITAKSINQESDTISASTVVVFQ